MSEKQRISREEMTHYIRDNIDFWVDEAISELNLEGGVSNKIAKKLILFGCYTIASKLED